MKVAVVDDDLWVRRGRATSLASLSGYDVIDLAPRAAMKFEGGWSDMDVVLVDAHDPTEPFDHFPGVGVVEAVRTRRDPSSTTIVVITGHSENAFLRLRLVEARADFLYRHEEVQDLATLRAVVEHPDDAHRIVPPSASVLRRIGLECESHLNAALHFLVDEHLEDSFDGKRSQKALDLSRRSIMKVRHEIARHAGLAPARLGGAGRHLDAPEWRAVVDLVNRARGLERRNVTLDPDDAS